MTDWFYRDFENRFRGSRELVRSRLDAYLPFIRPMIDSGYPAAALDLGCGRGEWLELLLEQGFDASGVDLDEGMLAACHELGLNVKNADAITTLQSMADESVAIVSAFHVAEHLPFDDVRVLVRQALRVLTPGGLLILETPNPDNLSVGSSSFYLDPTHHRPLPSTLLRFLTDHAGFGRSKILYLQESPDLHGPQPIALINVLTGVSPDYAVIAQKSADSHLMGVLDDAFQLDFGLKLDTLASRYDQQRDAHAAKQDAHAAKLENSLTHISAQLISLAKGAELQAEQLGQTTTQLTAVDVALHNLLSSRSWRITAPLRWLSVLAHRAWLRLVNSIKGRS